MQNQDKTNQERFWKEYLAGFEHPTGLPIKIKRKKTGELEGSANYPVLLEKSIKDQLEIFIKEHRVTMASFFYSTWGILLQRYCNNEDVIFGTTVSGRSAPIKGIQDLVGLFINTIPLRIKPGNGEKVKDLLDRVNNSLLIGEKYESTPLVDIKEYSGLEINEVLFDSIIALENYPLDHGLMRKNSQLPLGVDSYSIVESSNYDLSISITIGEMIGINFIYNPTSLEKSSILRLSCHFINIIENILINPKREISELEILSGEEKKQILYDFNDTEAAYPQNKTIHELFAGQAERTPDNIAVVAHELHQLHEKLEGTGGLAPMSLPMSITYKELERKSNQLAHLLKKKGVGPDTIVGIMMERSLGMIVGILAVLKAGGAFLPVDTDYPAERKTFMLHDSNTRILLTYSPLIEENNFKFNGEMILLDELSVSDGVGMNKDTASKHINTAGDLAYIMYTSGSTGKPKGVMVEHRNVVRLVVNTNYIRLTGETRILQTGAPVFDATTFEKWGALLNGGQLVLVEKEVILDAHRLGQAIHQNKINTLWLTSPLFNQLARENCDIFSNLDYLLVGGDVLSPRFINLVRSKSEKLKIINGYGPTENTTFSTTFLIDRDFEEVIPIGSPIANSTAFVLDQHGELQPVGVFGELWVGGDGVSRGYLNRPELTREKFVNLPSLGGKRLYRTGDITRWMPDGNIQFSRRIDSQVKIRGFRIEPGEIEKYLLENQEVKEALVIAREEETAEKYLCAYIIADSSAISPSPESPTTGLISRLQEYLSRELPDYMVPAQFVMLEKMPLNPNGKVDIKALPKPGIKRKQVVVAPRDRVEKQLRELWSLVLGMEKERISIDDDFFQLGGHSLKATHLAAKIHKIFNVNIPLIELFTAPTIRELAGYLKKVSPAKDKYISIEPASQKDYYVLSSAQKRLYLLQQMEKTATAYNMHSAWILEGNADKNRLESTFKKLIQRHESFRTSFLMLGEEPVQKVYEEVQFEIEHCDMKEVEVTDLISSSIRPFDLSQAPLLRVGLIKTREEKHILMVDMHHTIADGISTEVLAQDFMTLYSGKKLPKMRLQYKDYAQWQNREKKTTNLQKQAQYWKKQLEEEIPVIDLPTDYTRPSVQCFEGSSLSFELNRDSTYALKSLALEEGATLYMVLLALFNILLSKITRQEDIVVGTPAAGRRHADIEKIIGMFVNTLALRNYPAGGKTFAEFLIEIKKNTLKAFENQEYQYEDLVEQVVKNRDISRNPLFDVSFVLQDTVISTIEIPGLKLTPLEYISHTAKFDLALEGWELGEILRFRFEYSTTLFKQETIERFIKYFKNIVSCITGDKNRKISRLVIISGEEKRKLLVDFNDTAADYPKDRTMHELFEKQVERTPDNIAVIGPEPGVGTRFIAPGPGKQNAHLTYNQLNKASDQLACLLQEKGVQPDTIVGIMLERSLEIIIGILAILKASGAYMPIDPDYPEERINYMLTDSASKILVTTQDLSKEFQLTNDIIYLVDAINRVPTPNLFSFHPSTLPSFHLHLSPWGNAPVTSLAYIIYTSGSTGRPKGVMIEHSSVVNRLNWMQRFYPIGKDDVILHKTPFTFDVSVWELSWWSMQGAAVFLLGPGEEKDPEIICEAIEKNRITTMHFVPSMLNAFLEYIEARADLRKLPSLKQVFASGEALGAHQVERFNRHLNKTNGTKLINLYGPTEATVDVSYFNCSPGEKYKTIPIGRPIDNTQLYIINKNGGVQPIGVPGELCISGICLGRGYLNRSELTAEKFGHDLWDYQDYQDEKKAKLQKQLPKQHLTNFNEKLLRGGPDASRGGFLEKSPVKHLARRRQKLYKTGDLARWLTNGNIEFLGRMDQQVKIRGFRIELEEIENQLLAHDKIKEVVVTAKQDNVGDRYLAAYMVSDSDVLSLVPWLKEYLSKILPDYMIPSYFVQVAEIPLTPSGKTDRNALPEPETNTYGEYNAPRDEIEKKLVEIWAEVLGRDPWHASQLQGLMGIDNNFFQEGGHSLKAATLVSKIEQVFNIRFTLGEMFKRPTIRRLSDYIRDAGEEQYRSIEVVEEKEYYALSSAQKRLYFLHRLDETASAYNIPGAWLLEGLLGKNKLEHVFRRLIQRHESLRTSFLIIDEEPVQRIHKYFDFEIEYIDSEIAQVEVKVKVEEKEGTRGLAPLSKEPAARSSQLVTSTIKNFIQPFDLSKAPLIRVGLLEIEKNKHILMVDMHHIVSDGTSTGVLIKEFVSLNDGEEFPSLRLRYKDFSQWQRSKEQKELIKGQGEYWLEEFTGDIPVLNLPYDFSRPVFQGFAGSSLEFKIGEEETKKLIHLALAEDSTLYMVLLALFNIFLGKVSGQENIVAGSPAAGRKQPGLEQIIGIFINTLALRNYPTAEKSITVFLREVKENSLKAQENQDYPFEELVELVEVNRDTGRNPLFDVMLVFQNMEQQELQVPGLTLTQYPYENKKSKFDMTLTVVEHEDNISFTFTYNRDLFKKTTIRRFIGFFKRIAAASLENPVRKIAEIEIISVEEKKRVLYDFNATSGEYPPGKSIHRLFEEQVQEAADHIAVVGNPEITEKPERQKRRTLPIQISYKELNSRANQLGRLLKAKGVVPDSITGIMTGPSLEMIIGIMAILKAGGGYLPIDPLQPVERTTYMLKDSRAPVLLTSHRLAGPLPPDDGSGQQRVYLDDACVYTGDGTNLETAGRCRDVLYTIYTSGTTGKSKGTLVENKNLVNYIHWFKQKVHLTENDRTVLTSSFGFDLGYTNIYSSILSGCQLHLIPREVYLSPEVLLGCMIRHRVTYIKVTPSLFSTIVGSSIFSREACQNLRLLLLGGEEIRLKDVEKAHGIGMHMEIMNHYGPTEATIGCVARFIDFDRFDQYKKHPTIGSPIDNMKSAILDNSLMLVPVGVAGELSVSGAGVARGYLNQPELTAQKFLPVSHMSYMSHMSYIYKTGDMARWLTSGMIEFLGRIDQQVKIRGYRIETGEIQSRLLKHKAIKEVVVIPFAHSCGDKYLCAYIVWNRGEAVDPGTLQPELKGYLADMLPDYMIPSYFVTVDRIPLTPNGKLNRKLLPKPEIKIETRYAAPGDAVEEKLVKIWGDVLSLGDRPTSIGIDDNFFHWGGHSLTAIILISRIHKVFQVNVPLAEIFKTPTVRGLSLYIKSRKRARFTSIAPVEEKDYYILSSVQRRLYILHQMDENSTGYNMPSIMVLEGEIDKSKLQNAFSKLIERHESLRTSMVVHEGVPVQRIQPAVHFEIEYYCAERKAQSEKRNEEGCAPSNWCPAGDAARCANIIKNFIRPFDLSQAPLLRVGLMELPHTPSALRGHPRRGTYTSQEGREHKYILMVDMNHIISDGISRRILVKELMALTGSEELPALRIQYKDFSQWQNSETRRETLIHQEGYWRRQLEGEIPVLDLPYDYVRPAVQRFEGDCVTFELDQEEAGALKSLALERNTTLYMILLAIYYIFLSKLSNQEDILIGTPTAGRLHADLEPLIGMFVNTLVLRNYPRGGKTFLEFLNEIKERALQAFDNQDYQYENLVEESAILRDTSRNPLFDTMFVMQNMDIPEIEIPGLKLRPYEYQIETSKFDLTLIGIEVEKKLVLSVEYSTNLFKRAAIERFITYLKTIAAVVLENPGIKICETDILSGEEKRRILVDFNDTATGFPGDKTIHQIFEEQVKRTPDRIAIIGSRETLEKSEDRRHSRWIRNNVSVTYDQLNRRSNHLAYLLQAKGAKPGTAIGIMMERSPGMMVGIMAILKAGAAYLPLDLQFPNERIKYMCKDSNTQLVVTQSGFTRQFSYIDDVLALDNIDLDLSPRGAANPGTLVSSTGGAYIIYTSGTTGRPKGVFTMHYNVVRVVSNTNYIEITGDDRVLQLSNYAFDGSVFDIYGAFLNRAALVLVPEKIVSDAVGLSKLIKQEQVTLFFVTTALFNAIVDIEVSCLKDIRKILFGGERVSVEHTKKALQYLGPGKILHVYGPTETTVYATSYPVNRVQRQAVTIPIGRPISNTTVYILSRYLESVPLGVVGELHIGGEGTARGYLNRPQLTAEKFVKIEVKVEVEEEEEPRGQIPNPKSQIPDKHMSYVYKTGDLVRWLPDGNIEFIGRMDHQVKIRGFRIELGEIEGRLLRHEAVKETVVIDRERESGDKYLCAYIVLEKNETRARQLKEFLLEELPPFMIPGFFVFIDEIPLNPNGKVNRGSLPQPEAPGIDLDLEAPRNALEEKLAEIWAKVLGQEKERIGINSNFFELGGHSLKATLLAARIYKDFHIKVPLTEIFKTPTISGITRYIRDNSEDFCPVIVPGEKREYYDLSSAQNRLYILQQVDQHSTGYNIPAVFKLEGKVHKARLAETFRQLMGRHESLRTSFFMLEEEPVQKIHDQVEFEIEYYDFQVTGASDRCSWEEAPHGQIPNSKFQIPNKKEAGSHHSFVSPFDLFQAPLLRVGLIKIEEEKHILMLDIHHIICDGTSISILVKEFIAMYSGEELPFSRLQYKDFAAWQNSEKEKSSVETQEKYWLKEYAGEVPVLTLPIDYTRPPIQEFEGDVLDFEISMHQKDELNTFALKEGATLYMVLLALYNILLSRLSGQDEIVVGTPAAGRRHADLQQMIGVFINTLPLKNNPSGTKSFIEFIKEAKENALQAFANQDYPYENMVERLEVERDASRNPLFDVMFVFQNFDIIRLKIPGLKLTPYRYETKTSKFDMLLAGMEEDHRISLSLEYSTNLFEKTTIQRFITYFKTIISSVLEDSTRKLGEIDILPEEEKREILNDFNDTIVVDPWGKPVYEVFAQRALRTPDNTAVVGTVPGTGRTTLTFRSLNEGTNRLARLLQARGIKSDIPVGIMMERSLDILIGILAILKAGGTYLPIDPQFPANRISLLAKTSGMKLLLSLGQVIEKKLISLPSLSHETDILLVDEMGTALQEQSPEKLKSVTRPDDLIYIIFTSGSTGTPKLKLDSIKMYSLLYRSF